MISATVHLWGFNFMSILNNIKSLIQEMAFERDKAETRVTELGLPILYHLIKILKWEDPLNYDKHISDINNWLFDVQDVVIKPKGKRFKPDQYFSFLFEEQIESVIDVTKKINGKLQPYHNLREINSDPEVYNKLKLIYKQISIDISSNNFTNIRKYL